MKVAMIAYPWLPIPPEGYGGIENVLAVLIPALRKLGVTVELFTVGESTIKADKKHCLYQTGQYPYIHAPIYNSQPVASAHLIYALNYIKKAGDFDIIHTHPSYHDPLPGLFAGENLPPILYTLHGPPFTTPDRLALNIPDNLAMWHEVGKAGAMTNNFFLVGISNALMRTAPRSLKKITVPPVHNGVDPAEFPFVREKSNYFITLARSHPDKGQAIAVRACFRLGYKLKLAGVVGDMSRPRQVMLELGNPLSSYRGLIDFKYFSDEVFPYLDPGEIDYVGDLSGQNKLDFISHAKALLFPIQWEEPFGMAPIEALACGTPVIAMARGALPEIIQHGVNGFLANDEEEFEYYMQHVDEIDPAACRKSVEDHFSSQRMAEQYLKRYKYIVKNHGNPHRRPYVQHTKQNTPATTAPATPLPRHIRTSQAISKRLASLKPPLRRR